MARKPLVVDLCCGLGGWTRGFLAEGYDCIGFDIERHVYGEKRYPAQLVLQDVTTLDGRQFRGKVAVIVASPPCQGYSYRAMPWKRAKALPPPDNALFEACFRIAKEADCPIVVENVCGAQPWVGRAKWHWGSQYLWGDVPAVMPDHDGTWKGFAHRFDDAEMHKRRGSERTRKRTEWTALNAVIPFELATWIAKCFKPTLSLVA